jgi:hypothetical protein
MHPVTAHVCFGSLADIQLTKHGRSPTGNRLLFILRSGEPSATEKDRWNSVKRNQEGYARKPHSNNNYPTSDSVVSNKTH